MVGGSYALVAFVIGVLAGFQGIYERFRKSSWDACRTLLGVLYLLTRGLFAAIVYGTVSATPFLTDHPFWRALICGAGAEVVLRSKFYVKRIDKGAGNFEDLIRGPLDLLRWYQDLFLTTIEDNKVKPKIRKVQQIVSRWNSFPLMHERFEERILGFKRTLPEVIELKKAVANLNAKYRDDCQKAGGKLDSSLDRNYRYRLCYTIDDSLDEKGLNTIFEEQQS
jgi:hypothetical protein